MHSHDRAEPDARAVRAQVRRIVAAREFASAERMARFLCYAVEQALAGAADRLKEYSIGVEVFDRSASFDPAADPIVRVEARRLRTKLERYYNGEGRADELLITLPKGGYVPVFSFRQAPQPEANGRSIAVLPFVNLSPDPESSYLGDGLTWELIHRLTRVEGLVVVAWNSSSQLRGETQDIAAIGERLEAAYLVTGSIRRAGERIRVMAQLIDTRSHLYMWSESWDRQVADILGIQEEIAAAIASSLQVRLTGAPATKARRYDSRAYEAYLRGRVLWNLRTEDGLRRSVSAFTEATGIDPGFALGWAGLADAHALLADHGHVGADEAVGPATHAARRALELDRTLGEAHCSLAFVLAFFEWNWPEAGRHYRSALELNPGYATVHHWYACDYHAVVGDVEEGLREIDIARHLDPLSPAIEEGRGYVLLMARRFEEAADHFLLVQQKYPAFNKGFGGRGRCLAQLGRYDEAIAEFERARAIVGDSPSVLGALGQTLALAGRTEEARGLLARLHELARRRYVAATCFAFIHLGLGEEECALEWLEKGAARRDLPLVTLGRHAAWDALRGSPRFRALIRSMRLPA